MVREFRYPRYRIFTSGLAPVLLMAAGLGWVLLDRQALPRWMPVPFVILLLGLGLFAAIGTLHYPSRVVVSDEAIEFWFLGRKHRYQWKDVKEMRVTIFFMDDRALVRIGDPGLTYGRYWITSEIENHRELLALLRPRATSWVEPSRDIRGRLKDTKKN